MKKKLLYSAIALLLLLPLQLLSNGTPQDAEQSGVVSWINDGDTLQVDGIGTVRLLGIDTPEKKGGSRDNFYRQRFNLRASQLRQISRQATQFCIATVKGKKVRLVSEKNERDKHDRLLAYVYLEDGRMLNQLLLEQGLATVFRRFDFQRKEEFLALEQQARNNHQGLWHSQQ